MAKSEIIVGLDVGTTKVCAVVGEVSKGGVELVGHGLAPCRGLHKGMVVDIDATVAAITKAVEQAQQATGFQIRAVAAGITGDHVRSLVNRGSVSLQRLREVTEEDVEAAIDAAQRVPLEPGREIICTTPRLYTIDGHQGIRRPVGMAGTNLEAEALVITAQSSFVQNVIKCVHQADLAIVPGGLILESLATAEAVLSQEEKELGVALVDIGGGTSDLALFRSGSAFHIGAIPVGGNHVTNDLAVGLRVARPEAERIKLAHGTALGEEIDELDAIEVKPVGQEEGEGVRIPRRIVAEIVHPRMEELFELIQAEIEAAGALGMLPAGLVLSGGGSLLPGTIEVASRVLQMPVRLGVPRHAAAQTGTLRGPEFATGVGLVLNAARNQRRAESEDADLLSALLAPLRRWLRKLFS